MDQCAAVMPQPCLVVISPFCIEANIHGGKDKRWVVNGEWVREVLICAINGKLFIPSSGGGAECCT